jgi:hypothetical protein
MFLSPQGLASSLSKIKVLDGQSRSKGELVFPKGILVFSKRDTCWAVVLCIEIVVFIAFSMWIAGVQIQCVVGVQIQSSKSSMQLHY